MRLLASAVPDRLTVQVASGGDLDVAGKTNRANARDRMTILERQVKVAKEAAIEAAGAAIESTQAVDRMAALFAEARQDEESGKTARGAVFNPLRYKELGDIKRRMQDLNKRLLRKIEEIESLDTVDTSTHGARDKYLKR